MKKLLFLQLLLCIHILYMLFPRVPVLCFHRVVENPVNHLDFDRKNFIELIGILKREKYRFLKAGESCGFFENCVLLTFDDSTPDHAEFVAPFLGKEGIPALFFVVNERVNSDEATRSLWKQAMKSHKVGSHSLTMESLLEIPKEQLKDSIKGSKEKLKKLFENQALEDFAFPRGELNDEIYLLAKDTYLRNYDVNAGYQFPFYISTDISRLMLHHKLSSQEFRYYLSNARTYASGFFRLEIFLFLMIFLLMKLKSKGDSSKISGENSNSKES